MDFNRGGKPIGIEFTAPTTVTLAALNRMLGELGLPPLCDANLSLSARHRIGCGSLAKAGDPCERGIEGGNGFPRARE